jgi:hypothetical protein
MITCVVEYTTDVADAISDLSGCVLRYERSFMRPLLPATEPGTGTAPQ